MRCFGGTTARTAVKRATARAFTTLPFALCLGTSSCRARGWNTVARSKMGNPPYWFNHPNLPRDYIPNVQFGGQPANTIYAALPFAIPNAYLNPVYTIMDSISKVWDRHSFKAGVYIERDRKSVV